MPTKKKKSNEFIFNENFHQKKKKNYKFHLIATHQYDFQSNGERKQTRKHFK